MLPIDIIHLDLHEIPMIFLMELHELVENLLPAMERKAEIADTPCLTLLQKEIKQAVVYIPLLETLETGSPDGMKQIIIEIIGAQCLLRITIHLQTGLA